MRNWRTQIREECPGPNQGPWICRELYYTLPACSSAFRDSQLKPAITLSDVIHAEKDLTLIDTGDTICPSHSDILLPCTPAMVSLWSDDFVKVFLLCRLVSELVKLWGSLLFPRFHFSLGKFWKLSQRSHKGDCQPFLPSSSTLRHTQV